jgi:hypothetical protein
MNALSNVNPKPEIPELVSDENTEINENVRPQGYSGKVVVFKYTTSKSSHPHTVPVPIEQITNHPELKKLNQDVLDNMDQLDNTVTSRGLPVILLNVGSCNVMGYVLSYLENSVLSCTKTEKLRELEEEWEIHLPQPEFSHDSIPNIADHTSAMWFISILLAFVMNTYAKAKERVGRNLFLARFLTLHADMLAAKIKMLNEYFTVVRTLRDIASGTPVIVPMKGVHQNINERGLPEFAKDTLDYLNPLGNQVEHGVFSVEYFLDEPIDNRNPDYVYEERERSKVKIRGIKDLQKTHTVIKHPKKPVPLTQKVATFIPGEVEIRDKQIYDSQYMLKMNPVLYSDNYEGMVEEFKTFVLQKYWHAETTPVTVWSYDKKVRNPTHKVLSFMVIRPPRP